jgi:hypothetical protein
VLQQINNAVITNITDAPDGGAEQILSVTTQSQICPPAQPGMVTCLAMGMVTRPYDIRISSATQVLQKNRKPWTGGFEVGDHINAYGSLDAEARVMDARIVRNLDKPYSVLPQQISNLRVLSVTQGKDGLQVEAVSNTGPCMYSAGIAITVENSKMMYPCPAGMQPLPYVREDGAKSAMWAQVYQIAVPMRAQVLGANRKPLDRATLASGDVMNVYGTQVTRTIIQAQILRVTSRSQEVRKELQMKVLSGSADQQVGVEGAIVFQAIGGQAPYAWSVVGLPGGMELQSQGTIYCIKAPCPQPDTSVAKITGVPLRAGTYKMTLTATDATGGAVYITVPITVRTTTPTSPLKVSVATERATYRPDGVIGIDITIENPTRYDQTVTFNNGCQADYDVVPGFSLRSIQTCTLALGTLTLAPFEKTVYHFEHDLSAHPLPKMALPFDVTVIGRIQNVGEAQTTVRIAIR